MNYQKNHVYNKDEKATEPKDSEMKKGESMPTEKQGRESNYAAFFRKQQEEFNLLPY